MVIQFIIIMILLILLIGSLSIIKREYVYYKSYENARILKSVCISDIYDELKSGDIILYKCNSLSISGILANNYYTHIGMVVKYKDNGDSIGDDISDDISDDIGDSIDDIENKNIENKDTYKQTTDTYISETNPAFEYLPRDYKINNWYGLRPHIQKKIGWKTNYGADLLPLLVRLKYYPGECFIMKLNKPLDVIREQILLNAIEEKCPYPTAPQAMAIVVEKTILQNQKTYARHCFQHIAKLLDTMNITNNILDEYGFFSICNKIAYIDGKKLNDGFLYETPIKIIYDI